MYDIDLTLIHMAAGVIPRNRAEKRQRIRLMMIFGHDDQFAVIKLLIAKMNNFRVAAVVLPQQHGRGVLPNSKGR